MHGPPAGVFPSLHSQAACAMHTTLDSNWFYFWCQDKRDSTLTKIEWQLRHKAQLHSEAPKFTVAKHRTHS